MTDEKETPETGQTETESEGTEEVAEVEATEEAAQAGAPEGVTEAESAPETRYSRGQLQHMTIKKLREIALGFKEIAGVHGMQKDELVESIFALRGRDEAEGDLALALDKTAIKQEIRDLKERRASALGAGDSTELKRVRRRIKRLKRTLRKAS